MDNHLTLPAEVYWRLKADLLQVELLRARADQQIDQMTQQALNRAKIAPGTYRLNDSDLSIESA
jgi:hypothetical protein